MLVCHNDIQCAHSALARAPPAACVRVALSPRLITWRGPKHASVRRNKPTIIRKILLLSHVEHNLVVVVVVRRAKSATKTENRLRGDVLITKCERACEAKRLWRGRAGHRNSELIMGCLH